MEIFRISSILFYAWKYILQKMHLNHGRLFSGNFLGPVARSLVSANLWLRGIKMYRFPWYLTLVSTNHASSNPGLIKKWQWNLYQACIQEMLVIDSAWKALTDESENLPREKSVSPLLKLVSLFARFLFSICLLSSFLMLLFFYFLVCKRGSQS